MPMCTWVHIVRCVRRAGAYAETRSWGSVLVDGAIDGISDCYPIVYPSSCPSGTVLSNSGQCTSTDCNSTCNGPGTFDPTYSICNCDHANRVACDEACRATAPSTQICNGTSICITNPA